MIGTLGLAFDIGRMFIVRNELQTFVDASAIAACRQMDGTQTGVEQALFDYDSKFKKPLQPITS